MKFLTAYATTEGQTQKVARFCADQLTDSGHSVELLNLADDGEIDILRFDAVILAGSIHIGHYQKSLETFAAANLRDLKQRNTLFLSVSLAAAGNEKEDRMGLEHCIDVFTKATGWVPNRIEHIAGAFRFTSYDFFRYWAMRWIASQRDDEPVDPHKDKEYTDWDGLAAMLEDWSSGVQQQGSQA